MANERSERADSQDVPNTTAAESVPDAVPGAAPLFLDGDRAELSALLSLSMARTKRDYRRAAVLSGLLARHENAGREKWQEEDIAELDALLAQYSSLRDESMNTINNRVQVMLLGVAAIGAVAGGALTVENPVHNSVLVQAVFSFAIPLIAVFILFVWLSEAVRSHRVGYFLAADAEARINAKLGRLAMTWEAALWAGSLPRDERFGPSMMALAVVGAIAGTAPFFGLVVTGTPPTVAALFSPDTLGSRPIVVPYAMLGASIVYVLLNWGRLRNRDVIVSTLTEVADNSKTN